MRLLKRILKSSIAIFIAFVIFISSFSSVFAVRSYSTELLAVSLYQFYINYMASALGQAGQYLGDSYQSWLSENGYTDATGNITKKGVNNLLQFHPDFEIDGQSTKHYSQEDFAREYFAQNPSGQSIDEIKASATSTTPVSTKLWSDLKSDYYDSVKNNPDSPYYRLPFFGANEEFTSYFPIVYDEDGGYVDFDFSVRKVDNNYTYDYHFIPKPHHIDRPTIVRVPVIVTYTDYNSSTSGYYRRYYFYGVQNYSSGDCQLNRINLTFDCNEYKNGVISRTYSDYGDFVQCTSFGDINLPVFFSSADAKAWVDSFFSDQVYAGTGDIVLPRNHIDYKDLVDADALSKVLQGYDYVTNSELQRILEAYNRPNQYSTVNDYVTDARQFITNEYNTTVHEGDTVVNQFDDSRILSKLGTFGDLLQGLITIVRAISQKLEAWDFLTWFNSIIEKLESWKFVEWFTEILEAIRSWSFVDWWTELLTNVRSWSFADWIADIITAVKAVPIAIRRAFDDFLTDVLTIPRAIGDIFADVITVVKALPLTIADVIDLATTAIIDFFTIDPVAIQAAMPELNIAPDILPLIGISSGFRSRYANVNYPKIQINTPDIIRPFYKADVIILCDFADYADICSKVRFVMSWALYFGLAIWVIKHFKLHFTT